MSPTDDWNHMELVESNSSCDNIARTPSPPPHPHPQSPLPPPPSPTLSHVTGVQERLQLEKVNRWLRPRTKWSWFSKSTCGIWGGNGFAAKHSITRNYNNSTLEDGLFHFIMRFALSCLMVGVGMGHREWWQGLCETECSHFFLLCAAGVEPMDNYFFSRFDRSVFSRTDCHLPVTTCSCCKHVKATEVWVWSLTNDCNN